MIRFLFALMLFFIISVSSFAETRIITTSDGVKLHVTIKGEGTPCVYMHGGPGSGAYWLEYFSGDILENKFRMIYIDQRGVSRSGSPENGDFSLDRMIKDFEEVREALGIKKWLTLGHSFGGILQMAYAEKYRERLMGMIMINCTVDFGSTVNSIISFGHKTLNLPDTAQYSSIEEKITAANQLIGGMIDKDVFWKVHYAREENYHKMAEVMRSIENWNSDFSQKALYISDYFKDYRPLTENIELPVLFFYGKYDHAIGKQHYKGVEFPNMILWGAECKHVPFMECEDELNNALQLYQEFLQEKE